MTLIGGDAPTGGAHPEGRPRVSRAVEPVLRAALARGTITRRQADRIAFSLSSLETLTPDLAALRRWRARGAVRGVLAEVVLAIGRRAPGADPWRGGRPSCW